MSHLETTLGQLEAEKVDMKSALKTAGYFLGGGGFQGN